jgi:hypothetical protein
MNRIDKATVTVKGGAVKEKCFLHFLDLSKGNLTAIKLKLDTRLLLLLSTQERKKHTGKPLLAIGLIDAEKL